MIVGIGIDSVEIERVAHWSSWSYNRLARFFCEHEIAYCCANKTKQAERLAGRFAAREAFYKALTAITRTSIPFLRVCSSVCIQNNPAPRLSIDWLHLRNVFTIDPQHVKCHLSITHTKTIATAIVMLDAQSDHIFNFNQKKCN